MIEVVLAAMFTVFLIGFITVLCIGNYFRAKRAQERQKQRRLAKLAAQQSAGGQHARRPSIGSPRSTYSTGTSTVMSGTSSYTGSDHVTPMPAGQYQMMANDGNSPRIGGDGYNPPQHQQGVGVPSPNGLLITSGDPSQKQMSNYASSRPPQSQV